MTTNRIKWLIVAARRSHRMRRSRSRELTMKHRQRPHESALKQNGTYFGVLTDWNARKQLKTKGWLTKDR